jgi:DNA uptake protein ComE-like DNA-binding protein
VNKTLIIFVLSFLWIISVSAQQTDVVDDAKENLLQMQQDITENNENDLELLEDAINYLQEHQLEINKAGKEELQQLVDLGIITELQACSITDYRDRLGDFISIFELQAVPYLSLSDIYRILPFIRINNNLDQYQLNPKFLLTKGNWMMLTRTQNVLETQKGYTPPEGNSTTRYLGSPTGIYNRFRYNYANRFGYGATMQKDPGEEFFKGSQPNGFDFYSAHMFYRGKRFIKYIVVGDYQLRTGQGLLLGNGIGGRKSPYVLMVKKGGQTIRPYTSVNEYLFFRGSAATFNIKPFDITVFYSQKKIDTNVQSVTDTIADDFGNTFITSFGGDGFHRTLTEVSKKNLITQSTYGAHLDYRYKKLSLGATAIRTQFDVPLRRTEYVYSKYQFNNSNTLTNASVDYTYQYRNMLFFGEMAVSDNCGKATLNGLLMSLSQKADLAMVYRNYSRDFQSLYPNAFAESSRPDNEKGLYVALSIRLRPTLILDLYSDWYKFPWLSYQIDAPSVGKDYFSRLTYRPNKKLELYAQYRSETKQRNSSLTNNIDYLVDNTRNGLRLNLTYKVSRSFMLRGRAEWSSFNNQDLDKPQKGYLIYQDIIYKQLGVPLTFTFRYMLFNVDDYNARIYVYENDVLYAYSIPAFQNKGTRYYLVARYTLNRHFDIYARFAQTIYDNIKTIGSSLELIDGNTRSELKLSVRLKF